MCGEIKSAVSCCLTAPCFSLRPALLVLEVPSAWDGSGPVSEIFQPTYHWGQAPMIGSLSPVYHWGQAPMIHSHLLYNYGQKAKKVSKRFGVHKGTGVEVKAAITQIPVPKAIV